MFSKISTEKFKWAGFFVVSVFLISNLYFSHSLAQVPTLGVTLGSNPTGGGNAPLVGLTMTANVSGTATGPINYYFYCNAANDNSTIVIPGYAYSLLGTNSTTVTTPAGICDSVYANIGTYLAKVIVERGGIAAEDRRTVGVFNPLPQVDLKIRPVGGTDWSDWMIDIDYNTAAEIRWTFSGAPSCTMSGDWSGTKTLPGQESTGNLTEGKTYIYTLECNTSGGVLTDTVMARVAPPTLFGSISASPNSGTAPLSGVILTANVTGGTAIGATNYTFYCNRSDAGTNVTSGYAYKLDATDLSPLSAPAAACNSVYANVGTYTAKVILERGGVAAEARTTVTVTAPPPPAVSLTADSTNLANNTSTTLRWTVSNANTCTGSGGTSSWAGSKAVPTGTQQTDNLSGPNTYTYTLSCTGAGGTRSASVIITVSAPPAPVISLTADSTSLAYDTSTTLRWTVSNANTCTGSGGTSSWVGSKAVPTGTQQTDNLSGPNTYTYTLSCTGAGGTRSASVIISVGSPPQRPTVILTAEGYPGGVTVAYGTSVTLEWAVYNNADECYGTGGTGTWPGDKNRNGGGEGTGNLFGPDQYIYTITCSNAGGSSSSSVTINVLAEPPLVTLDANPTQVDYNSSTDLSWIVESDVPVVCNANWAGFPGTLSGSMSSVPLTTARTFTITCSNQGGQAQDSITVTVASAPIPTVSIQANPADVDYNGSTTITWSSTNATRCEASGDWWGPKATSGTYQASNLRSDKAYAVTCYNATNDWEADFVNVYVGAPPQDDTSNGTIIFENPLQSGDIQQILSSLAALIRMIAIGIAGIMIIISGIIILTSIDDRERLNKGKNMLKWTLVGLAVALASSFIVGLLEELLT